MSKGGNGGRGWCDRCEMHVMFWHCLTSVTHFISCGCCHVLNLPHGIEKINIIKEKERQI